MAHGGVSEHVWVNKAWFGSTEIWLFFQGIWSCYYATIFSLQSIPDAPCMAYLPTFGHFLGHMLVNIPAPWFAYGYHQPDVDTRC